MPSPDWQLERDLALERGLTFWHSIGNTLFQLNNKDDSCLVTMYFDGGGDSGDLSSIDYYGMIGSYIELCEKRGLLYQQRTPENDALFKEVDAELANKRQRFADAFAQATDIRWDIVEEHGEYRQDRKICFTQPAELNYVRGVLDRAAYFFSRFVSYEHDWYNDDGGSIEVSIEYTRDDQGQVHSNCVINVHLNEIRSENVMCQEYNDGIPKPVFCDPKAV